MYFSELSQDGVCVDVLIDFVPDFCDGEGAVFLQMIVVIHQIEVYFCEVGF